MAAKKKTVVKRSAPKKKVATKSTKKITRKKTNTPMGAGAPLVSVTKGTKGGSDTTKGGSDTTKGGSDTTKGGSDTTK